MPYLKKTITKNSNNLSFRTELDLPKSESQIKYDSNILFIGSCFSEEIGAQLLKLKYNVNLNPAGITFNPTSILTTIRCCTSDFSLPEEKYFFHNGLWKNSDFHSEFNKQEIGLCRQSVNNSINTAKKFNKKLTHFVVTLGTAYVYEDKHTGLVVNNCHKRPQEDFRKRLLKIEEIEQNLSEMIHLLNQYSDNKIEAIITISPVRHIKDGIIQNQRSKSRLIEAVHSVVENNDNISYFPAYEILLDDLRDYRFYTRDLIHPSEEAVDYIYDIFEKIFLREEDSKIRERISQLNRDLRHKPRFPNSPEHKAFVNQLIRKINELQTDFPKVSFEDEIENLV